MKHKWHKEIKAWADGAQIEFKYDNDSLWKVASAPQWFERDDVEYRIKPQPKEPQYLYAWSTEIGIAITLYKEDIPSQYKRIGKIKLEVDDD